MLQEVPTVWIMGGPGSGKGTQAQKIQEQYGFKHIDPIALVEMEVMKINICLLATCVLTTQSQVETKTPAGQKFQKFLSDGTAIPLPQIVPLIEKQLMSHRGALKGFVIDG